MHSTRRHLVPSSPANPRPLDYFSLEAEVLEELVDAVVLVVVVPEVSEGLVEELVEVARVRLDSL